MKLLSVAVPCYNSQDYMRRAVDSLLPGGDEVEILIVDDVHLRRYMVGFLEIITAVSSVMLLMDGSKAALEKRDALWAFIRERDPALEHRLRRGMLGRLVLANTRPGRAAATLVYRVSQKIYGFN